MEAVIQQLSADSAAPYDLLLLADPSRENVDDYLSRGICCTATVRGEVVGVFVLIRTRPSTMEIVNVAVREDFQGRGIGKMLVQHAIGQAKEQRAKTVEIGTGNSGIHQLALYQKCGFRMAAIDSDFFVRHYDEEIYENGIRCRDMVRLRLDL